MPEEEKSPGVKKDGDAEPRTLSPESKDGEVHPEGEKAVPDPEPNPPDPSNSSLPQGSPSSTKKARTKVELDLEGLAKGKEERPAAPPAPDPRVPAKGKRWPPAVAFSVLAVLVLGVFWFGYKRAEPEKNEKEEVGVSAPSVPPQEDSQPTPGIDLYVSYGLAPFFVPIPEDQSSREGFLKVTLILAFKDRVPSDEIDKKILTIRSRITDVLFGKSLRELQSAEGKMTLKREIKDSLNASLDQAAVRRVYFEEFFIL